MNADKNVRVVAAGLAMDAKLIRSSSVLIRFSSVFIRVPDWLREARPEFQEARSVQRSFWRSMPK
jgi:hypothetical protein